MCFVKMHRPLHGLTRFRRLLRERLINCPADMPAPPQSDRKRLRDQACLFAFMKSESTDSGTGAGVAPGVANFAAKHGTQARLDETPRPHVLRFLLAPNQSCFLRKSFNRRAQLLLIQRIKLFDADNRAVGNFFLFAVGNKIEIDFSGTQDNTFDFVELATPAGDRGYRIGNNFVKFSACEIFRARSRKFRAQQTFWRHQDEWLDEITLHLPPQNVEILRGRGGNADLDVVFGAGLKKPLKPGAGMFWALSFVAVRQKQNDPARSLPLRFGGNDKLIDNSLRPVNKIAELRLPQAQHVWIIERVAVIESEDGGFRKETVVNTNAGLFFREMQQRIIRSARFCIVPIGMTLAEGSAPAVLAGQSNRNVFQQERSKRQRFGKSPIIRTTRLNNLPAPVDQHPFHFRQNVKPFRN